ncbi:hypothetical protein [Propionibacterium sp.]|uniref:hypothetical protein n=1 Tax=Propionibacterium sp. TaxID=1977903 RepID=UPI0039EBCFF8
MHASTRLAAAGSALLIGMAVTLTGCSGLSSPVASGNPGSDATPSMTETPKLASRAQLPASFDGWAPTSSPTAMPTDIDNSRSRMQTAVFLDGTGKQSRIVTLLVSSDKGYVQSQRKALDGGQALGQSFCGTPTGVPNATSCIIVLDGGLLQTTETGQDASALAEFTNGIYASFE